MRRLLLCLVVLLAPACSGGGEASGDTVEMLDGQRFSPASLTVAPGTTVTFENKSSEAHTVTTYEGRAPVAFSSGGFESEEEARDSVGEALVGQEGSFEFTFEEPGTYEYFCIPHEDQGMKGTVVVEGE